MQRAVEALQRQLSQGEEERSRLKKELSEMAVKAVAVEKARIHLLLPILRKKSILGTLVTTPSTVPAADPDAGTGPLHAQQPHQGAAAHAGRQGERLEGRHQHAEAKPAVRMGAVTD